MKLVFLHDSVFSLGRRQSMVDEQDKHNIMMTMKMKYLNRTVMAAMTAALLTTQPVADANAQNAGNYSPLVVTNKPLPTALEDKLYAPTGTAPQIKASDISGSSYFAGTPETLVGRKANELRSELFQLQGDVASLSEQLTKLEQQGQRMAAEYYASVATISTQLQSGTTPGNPRLVSRLTTASMNLERLTNNLAALNKLGVEVSSSASMASYILSSARAAFTITGAVEEDHVRLSQLEDSASKILVAVDRLSGNVNDDITRTTAYLNTERENLRTLSLAITTGDMFGRNLASQAYGGSPQTTGFAPTTTPVPSAASSYMPAPVNQAQTGRPAQYAPTVSGVDSAGMRPLVKIRFDKASVAYEQPVYMAVNEALTRFPNARFELVAVHPSQGNAAQVAIESTRSRRNAEKVLRSLAQMGLPMDRIELSYTPSAQASTSEVHLYVR
jgi:hypothetical protein